MKSGLITISDLFDGTKKFQIPKYQRAYAWEETHWKDFLEDVLNHPSGHKYFYGTILLREGGKDNEFEILEVVDGQQRITTMTILFYRLLLCLKSLSSTKNLIIKEEKYINYHGVHKLKLGDDADNEFFQTYVLSETQNNFTFSTPAQRLLMGAKKYFSQELNELSLPKLEAIMEIVENAEVLVYSVKESAEATLIFETTNDRGKSLTNLEKIKSFLMYKAYLSASNNASDLIDNIHSRFGDIYQVIERNKSIYEKRGLKVVTEDQICQYHFIGFRPWSVKADYQNYLDKIKEQVNTLTQKKQYEDTVKFIEQYTVSLRDTFYTFEKIITSNSKLLNEIIYLERIAVFYPLLMISYQFDKTDSKSQFNHILELLAKFSFRIFALKFKRTNDVDVFLNKLARDFDGDFEILTRNLSDKIEECASMPDFVSKLKAPNFYSEFDSKTKNFLYWKYENHLRINEQPICGEMSYEELNDENGRYKISIEHITSQTPKNGLQFSELTNEFSETYLHSIGNLTIDPQSSNSSKGNEIWINKNEKYFQKAPFKTQLELSDFVDDSIKKWNDQSINRRRDKIINIAESIWKV